MKINFKTVSEILSNKEMMGIKGSNNIPSGDCKVTCNDGSIHYASKCPKDENDSVCKDHGGVKQCNGLSSICE